MKIKILERIRQEKKLSKAEMARRLGIAKSYYSMIVNEDRAISKNVAIKIHDVFGVPLEDTLLDSKKFT